MIRKTRVVPHLGTSWIKMQILICLPPESIIHSFTHWSSTEPGTGESIVNKSAVPPAS